MLVTVMPDKVEVVDTVGAGDTFNAGILALLHEQGRLSKSRIAGLSEAEIQAALTLGAPSSGSHCVAGRRESTVAA